MKKICKNNIKERFFMQKANMRVSCLGITIPTMSRIFKALGIDTATLDLGFAGKVALW